MNKKRILFFIVIFSFLIVFVVSLYNILSKLSEYEKSKDNYKNIQEENVTVVTSPSEVVDAPKETAPIVIDFDNLLKQNADVIGWIYCEGTPINYPVMQSLDNNYYLRRSLNKKYDISGSIFMDYRSDANLSNLNTLIYGHNMRNNMMFGTFENYKKQSYYDEHPIMWYFTPHGNYKIELFAGFVAPSDSRIYTDFSSYEKMIDQSRRAIEKSTFNANIQIENAERIVTLSTCSYDYDDARYILLGTLKKIS